MSYLFKPYHPHACPLPQERPPVGAVWQCDVPTCLQIWVFRYAESSWGPTWDRLRWWNWRIRRQINNKPINREDHPQ